MFSVLYFEKKFLKNENPFQKKLEYHFLIESTKTENAKLRKIVLSEANVKTNRMGSIKWTYHNERRFASNDFMFQLKKLV